MLKSRKELPAGYREIFSVNLQKDKKAALWLNIAAGVIMIAMIVPMTCVVPLDTLFDMSEGMGIYALRFVALIVAVVAYIVAHEAVHGIVMKLLGTKKVKFGFTGLYAFAGSEEYYGKRAYILIALAPVVVFGVIFGVLCAVVPPVWFWVVYTLQIFNISGAAGDFYVTIRFARMPKDILVQDSGVGMTVYSASEGDD